MQDDKSQNEHGGSSSGAASVRINLPTAAAVAGTPLPPERDVDQPESDVAEPDDLEFDELDDLDLDEPDLTGSGDEDQEPPRLIGRTLAERIAANSSPSESDEPKTGVFVLPDWTDPPTGLVPRVLLDDEVVGDQEGDLIDVGLRGPSWREDGSDWDNDPDLAFLIEEDTSDETAIAGQITPTEDPFQDGFSEIARARGITEAQAEAKWDAAFGGGADPVGYLEGETSQPDSLEESRTPRPTPRRRHRRVRDNGPARSGERNIVVATGVGLLIGALALLCFSFGAPSTIIFVAFTVTLAAAELFSSLQRAGYRPATLLGLIAVPVLIVGTYLHGSIAVPFTIFILVLGFAIWGIAGLSQKEPVINLGVTALVVFWTGILGSFAGLLLNAHSFPHRHGVAYVVGAIALTVAHDVGSFAIGHRFGRHPIAPRVSPGKTREGLAGGSLLTLVVAVALVAHLHPYTLSSAILLAVVVMIFAPLGDLFESVIKRDLGLKDMGKILPAHGGIFDRIDAMLFVLPACYLLIRALGKH